MLPYLLVVLLSAVLKLHSTEQPILFEGILGSLVNIANPAYLASYFLPYNPIVIEIGGYQGNTTETLVAQYQHGGCVIVFEPHPKSFEQLVSKFQGNQKVKPVNLALNTYNGMAKLYIQGEDVFGHAWPEGQGSLLERVGGKDLFIEVPCVILDDWCEKQGIRIVDCIQLDVEGLELEILKSSPEILKTVKVICTKTNLQRFRKNTVLFVHLKRYLEKSGFEMISHWYRQGLQGEATFIRKEMYDSVFR